jgi:hypothetical protein
MRFVLDLRETTQGVEGEVTREGSGTAEPFCGWLELLRLLELRPASRPGPRQPDPPPAPSLE